MCNKLVGLLVFTLGIIATHVQSKTDSPDVSALNVMFTSFNSPSKLSGWKSSGGDPCDDSWEGITCSGSAVKEIRLSGLGLTGSMGYQLSSLSSVTYFDLSQNNLKNDIPYQLPPNAVHIDLSANDFTGNVPYSISQMTDLEYLDLGHNQLNGQLSDMFGKLTKLEMLDLSYNSITGNLPQSFASLKSLISLYLQKNKFTGSIDVLAKLDLKDLNVENNQLTGWIPDKVKEINNLKTGGNPWSKGLPPPGEHSASDKDSDNGKKSGGYGLAIGLAAMGSLVVLALLFILFSKKKSTVPSNFLDEERASRRRAFSSLSSRDSSHDLGADVSTDYHGFKPLNASASASASININSLQKSPSIRTPLTDRVQSYSDNDFANRLIAKRSNSIHSTAYSLTDLQTATANFATGRLLGEGTIGRVYRAKYPDKKVLAVKKIDSSLFHSGKGEEFSAIVANISRVHHPNIAELVGYCSEQGHNLLIHEYFRNGSLHEFLHLSDDFSRPLTWNTRVRIAMGAARSVEYLHEVCSPSIIHKNIKSSNILLDNELNPRLSDYGLANFHQRTSQNLGVGYNAPECTQPSAYTMKSDVYSFGVVMLELLTGRMPFDSKRPKSEQSLVRWASSQLHDIDALCRMVDPALRGLYPPKSLSRFADVIALCVQVEPEFRPPISEVVQALVRLVQRSSMNMRDDLTSSCRTEDSDY